MGTDLGVFKKMSFRVGFINSRGPFALGQEYPAEEGRVKSELGTATVARREGSDSQPVVIELLGSRDALKL